MSRLPGGSLNVVIIDVLLGGSGGRKVHRLSNLDDALLAGGGGGGHCSVVAVWDVCVDARRVEFCSHLLL